MRMKVGLAAAHRIVDIGQIAAYFFHKKLTRKFCRPSGTSRCECLDTAFMPRQTLQLIHRDIGKLSVRQPDCRHVPARAESHFAGRFADFRQVLCVAYLDAALGCVNLDIRRFHARTPPFPRAIVGEIACAGLSPLRRRGSGRRQRLGPPGSLISISSRGCPTSGDPYSACFESWDAPQVGHRRVRIVMPLLAGQSLFLLPR